tara:strand:+ start:261 stop:833 length:573 start_codon:yes stop_codon:yes gene_type:complete
MKQKLRLLNNEDTILLIIDAQEKLMKNISNRDEIIWNIKRMIKACTLLSVEKTFSEQNPSKLGHTINSLKSVNPINIYEKMSFSCFGCKELGDFINSKNKKNIIVCGVETHVCVLHTCIDLLNRDFTPHIILDAVGSRFLIDHETSLRKLELAGAILSTTESVIFELCKTADRNEFREISKIIRETINPH